MRRSARLTAVLFALAFVVPLIARGDDDKTRKDEKPAEKPAAQTDVTTQGSVDAGGQHILYNAIAGTRV